MSSLFPNAIPLHIGGVIYGNKGQVVRTILGSCISICMYHGKSGNAAICHAMYSSPGPRDDARHVPECVRMMAEHFREVGLSPGDIIVKVFGGASSQAEDSAPNSNPALQNIDIAVQELNNAGFQIFVKDTGGIQSRELYFDMSNGDVFIRKMKESVR